MDYKEIFDLAQTKGYHKSVVTLVHGRTSIVYSYNESEIDGISSLAAIQEWLATEHRFSVAVIPRREDQFVWQIGVFPNAVGSRQAYDNYLSAFKSAIFSSLKLIQL